MIRQDFDDRLGRVFGMAVCVAMLSAAPALADYPEETAPPDLTALKDRIETGDRAAAEQELRAILVLRPGDADVLNLLGYANRKLARYGEARGFYGRALSLDPRHKGALEYLGELELETGHPAAAQQLRARLEAICPDGCEELDDLNEAFAEHGL